MTEMRGREQKRGCQGKGGGQRDRHCDIMSPPPSFVLAPLNITFSHTSVHATTAIPTSAVPLQGCCPLCSGKSPNFPETVGAGIWEVGGWAAWWHCYMTGKLPKLETLLLVHA